MSELVSMGFNSLEGLKCSFIIKGTLIGGTQVLFRFPNGLGASVVRHQFSYGGPQGLWEMMVIEFDGLEGSAEDKWNSASNDYQLPGFDSDNVRGWMSESDIDEAVDILAKKTKFSHKALEQ